MDTITPILQQYTAALNAEIYHYRLVHPVNGTIRLGHYSDAQLIRAKGFFYALNQQGFNIYVRPVGWQYVLLDDLTRDVLADVASLKPCMLLETSPANYQAWLILSEVPQNREAAKAICKELAIQFGADLASAEPDHVGRLPGFTNRKEKHRTDSGRYPFVKLHKSENRQSTFLPHRGGAVQSTAISSNGIKSTTNTGNTQSENDFAKACQLIRAGKNDDEIETHLTTYSTNLYERKGKATNAYLKRTILKARRVIQGHI